MPKVTTRSQGSVVKVAKKAKITKKVDANKTDVKKDTKKVEKKISLWQKKNQKMSNEPEKEGLAVAKSASNYENNQLKLGDGKWKKDVIKLATWNINGIRCIQKKGELRNYIEDNKPDALILNETRIDETKYEEYKSEVDIPKEYHQYWSFCTIKKGYSGVCLFSKVKPISIKEGMGVLKHDLEGRLITAEYENFFLVGVYVPHSGSFFYTGELARHSYRVEEWDVDFLNYLNKLKETKPVVQTGDLNIVHKDIDIWNPKGKYHWACMTPEERQGMDNFIKCNWVDTFRDLYPEEKEYSQWSLRSNGWEKNEGSRVDYFMTNRDAMDAVKDSRYIVKQRGSDHCPVELDLEVNKLPKYYN